MMNEMITDMVDEMLDEGGDVVIGGRTFSRSYILEQLDPIAYREVCLGYVNCHLDDLQDELQCLDPETDADQVEFLKERIAELEEF